MRKPRLRQAAILLLSASLVSSCTTFETVRFDDVQPGDVVRITTVDGGTQELEIRRVDESKLMSSRGTISALDAVRIERQTTSILRTLGLVLGLGAAATVGTGQNSPI